MEVPELERPTTVTQVKAGPVEYRLRRKGPPTILVFHGGHMRAGLALGEEVFTDLGYSLLVPSRPGYGRTPLETGRSPIEFTRVVRELCAELDITEVAAVVGISGGGPTAVTMAAKNPDFVQRLILESAVGFLSWPTSSVRTAAGIGFGAHTERATWAIVHTLMRFAPETSLRYWLGTLSTGPGKAAYASLSPDDRRTLVGLFSMMRSGRGFLNDFRPTPDLTSEVRQPALVIATRKDGGVPFANAESLVASIRGAQLIESEAATHLIWFGRDYPVIVERISRFLGPAPSHHRDPPQISCR